MTFDASEKLRFAGLPVQCFKFTKAGTSWFYTSADEIITTPDGVFLPEPISCGEVEYSGEDSAETLEITVTRTNPIGALFIASLPSYEIGVTAYMLHRGSESDRVAFFSGKVDTARGQISERVLRCSSIKEKLRRPLPQLRFQTTCNHRLYSPGCGANPNLSQDAIVISTVSGPIITSNDFLIHPSGWFKAGKLQGPTGEQRAIIDHVGDTVRLLGPMPDLKSLDQCIAFWGCNHLTSDCGPAKFNVLVNYLGAPWIPTLNPAVDGVDR